MNHLLVAVVLGTSLVASAQDAGVPLLPRELLYGNPERTAATIAPDGKRLAWLAPDDKNVLQLHVQTLGTKEDVTVTGERKRGIRVYDWAKDGNGLVYLQDDGGDENYHLFHVDLTTRTVRDLTPWQGVRANLLETNSKFPDQVLITANVRDRKLFDVYRVSLKTGATDLDTQNPGDVTRWFVDTNFQVRGAVATLKDGSTEVRTRETVKSPWKALLTASLEESVSVVDFTEDGRSLVLTTTVDADTDRVVEKSLRTGAERAVASSPTSDLLEVFRSPVRKQLRAVAFDVGGRRGWTTTDYTVKPDFDALGKAMTGDFSIVSVDTADSKWIIRETRDTGPMRYWLWDRKAKQASVLFSTQPKLEGMTLAPMTPVSFPARDGTTLTGYLTRLPGDAKRPLVVLVHAGPWARDGWGFSPSVQLLANRGYAVLQVNFRGSTGFGKRFLNLGNRQWGLGMQDDLTDGVAWAVAQGVADPGHVAIAGSSYGGYAALMGLALTPELYACGVDFHGPGNLAAVLSATPAYWSVARLSVLRRVGDPDDPKDRELLKQASASSVIDRVRAPVLVVQGANDVRVKPAESEQLVAALEKKGVPVTYALYADEGHGLVRPENAIDAWARVEQLFGKCLGGRTEPLPKDGKASVTVKTVGRR